MMVQAQATLVYNSRMANYPWRARVEEGDYEGTEFCLSESIQRGTGQAIEVRFDPDDQFAKVISWDA